MHIRLLSLILFCTVAFSCTPKKEIPTTDALTDCLKADPDTNLLADFYAKFQVALKENKIESDFNQIDARGFFNVLSAAGGRTIKVDWKALCQCDNFNQLNLYDPRALKAALKCVEGDATISNRAELDRIMAVPIRQSTEGTYDSEGIKNFIGHYEAGPTKQFVLMAIVVAEFFSDGDR